jgi:carbon-monoxide dehydrogenase catalytic subunit
LILYIPPERIPIFFAFSTDPFDIAKLMIDHIDKKRKALGIDKARERVLMDMSDRREIDAA